MELQQLPHSIDLHLDKGFIICSCSSHHPTSPEAARAESSGHAQKHAHDDAVFLDNPELIVDLFMGIRKRMHLEHVHRHRLFEECDQCMHVDFERDDANQCLQYAGEVNVEARAGENMTFSPALNPSVWKSLPAELLERILACLPMASLFKFRVVCHAWNAAPFRPRFRNLRARMMIPETWLIMLGRPRGSQSRSTSSTSHDSCLSFVFNLELSKAVALRNTFLPFPRPSFGCISYCATAGGLICYHYHMGFSTKYEKSSVSLWVGNPFTKEWKCLPPMVGSFPLNFPLRGLAGMVILDSVANNNVLHTPHYKIIVRTQSRPTWGSEMMTEEYDSHTNAWRVTTVGNVPSDHRIEQVLHCSGSLYFLTWQVRDGIYVYHLAKQNWSRILPPKLRYQFTSPHMVECCGHLLLVSGVGKHHTIKLKGVRRLHIRTTGIKLWQLVEKDPFTAFSAAAVATAADQSVPSMSASCWSSISRMPEELVQEFVTGVHFQCTSIRNLIYLTNSISMLIFNVVARMWRRVIITQPSFLVQDFVSFVPKLEASP